MCDVADICCRKTKRSMCGRAFDSQAFFIKTCELPVLAFSLGPDEDICIPLATVAVPEWRLSPATPLSSPVTQGSHPSCLFSSRWVVPASSCLLFIQVWGWSPPSPVTLFITLVLEGIFWSYQLSLFISPPD